MIISKEKFCHKPPFDFKKISANFANSWLKKFSYFAAILQTLVFDLRTLNASSVLIKYII